MTARGLATVVGWTAAAVVGLAGVAAAGGAAGIVSYRSTLDELAGGAGPAYQQAYDAAHDVAYAQARAAAEAAAASDAYRLAYDGARDEAMAAARERAYTAAFKKAYLSAFAQQAAEFRCEGTLPDADADKACLTEAWRLAEEAYAAR